MFNEALLIISLTALPNQVPLTVMEVPYRDLETCSVAAKELHVKVHEHLTEFKLKYKTSCMRVGFNS